MSKNQDESFKSKKTLQLINCFYLFSMKRATVQFMVTTGKQDGILL